MSLYKKVYPKSCVNFPNFDTAFGAMTEKKDYKLTLEQDNVPFTKFVLPAKVKSLTIDGNGHTLDIKSLVCVCRMRWYYNG